jgi:hypothetical protein
VNGRLSGPFFVVACALAAVATGACDGFVGFIAVGPTGFAVVIIDPPVVVRQPYLPPGCPMVAPIGSFQLVVRQPAEDVSLHALTLRFMDGSGASSDPIPYGPSEMTKMFGSTLVAQGATRAFNFSVPYGCHPAAPTTMSARVAMVTRSGHTVESDATAAFK